MDFTTIKKRADFVTITRKGKKIVAKGLVLQAMENPENNDDTRFGFTVTKKVSKKAVVRNRIKRRLRALVRESGIPVRKGVDYVLIGRKSTFDRPFEGLIKDFKYAMYNVSG